MDADADADADADVEAAAEASAETAAEAATRPVALHRSTPQPALGPTRSWARASASPWTLGNRESLKITMGRSSTTTPSAALRTSSASTTVTNSGSIWKASTRSEPFHGSTAPGRSCPRLYRGATKRTSARLRESTTAVRTIGETACLRGRAVLTCVTPCARLPTGHVYVRWLGEDYSKLPPEMLDSSKVQGFDEGSANVWTMGVSRKDGRKAPTANKDKFLRSLAVAMAFAPEAKRVRMAANALEGMTEEELSDASQNPTAYEQKRLNSIEHNRDMLRQLNLI